MPLFDAFYLWLNFNGTCLLNPFFLSPLSVSLSTHPLLSTASGAVLQLWRRRDGAACDGGRCWHQEGRDPSRAAGDHPL